jgi:hypothetical protein
MHDGYGRQTDVSDKAHMLTVLFSNRLQLSSKTEKIRHFSLLKDVKW